MRIWLSLFLTVFLLILGFNNCGQFDGFKSGTLNGTEIGNPDREGEMLATTYLLQKSCELVMKCSPQTTLSECQQTFRQSTSVSSSLGGPSGLAFSELELRESNGLILVDQNLMNSCVNSLNQLSCQSAPVGSAIGGGGGLTPNSNLGSLYSQNQDCASVLRAAN